MHKIFDKETYDRLKKYEFFLFWVDCPCTGCLSRFHDDCGCGLEGTCSCNAFKTWEKEKDEQNGRDIDVFVEKCGLTGYFQRIHEFLWNESQINWLKLRQEGLKKEQNREKFYCEGHTLPREVIEEGCDLRELPSPGVYCVKEKTESEENDGLKKM